MDYSPWFFFPESEKVLKKVYHPKGNEKRNLMALVSVCIAPSVGSYERLKFSIRCTFEWETNLGD